MKDNLTDYLDRPKRYDNIDGTGEIFMGMMMLGFALIGYLQRVMPHDSFWSRYNLIFMYAVMAPVLGLGFLIQKLVKRNITFPRTGYVARGSAERPVATKTMSLAYGGILGAIFALIISAVLIPLVFMGKGRSLNLDIARIFYAALFIATYAFWIWRMGQGQRWKWAILVLMTAAMVIAGTVVPVQGGFGDLFYFWVSLVSGVSWVVSGIGTLIVYMRHHHLPSAA